MSKPDILALEIEVALSELQLQGYQAMITYTKSPFPSVKGVARVVRIDAIKDRTFFLTVAYDTGRRGGVDGCHT